MVVALPDELAATREPGGPEGPVDTYWLILQRLDDLRRGQDDHGRRIGEVQAGLQTQIADTRRDLQTQITETRTDLQTQIADTRSDLRAQMAETRTALQAQIAETRTALQTQIDALKRDTGWVRNYALGIVLVAVLGLLARSFVPLH